MKTREYYVLLTKSKNNLSLILLLTKICSTITWVGGVSGLIILFIRWINSARAGELPFDYLSVWLLVTLFAGGGLGLIMARYNIIDLHKTAQWLDNSLSLNEVLTAAHLCLNRNCTGVFDQRIVNQAESCAGEINNYAHQLIKWPVKNLNRQVKITIFTILVFTLLITWWNPEKTGFVSLQELTLNKDGIGVREEASQATEILMNSSAKEIADLLFSYDQELAQKAEDALNSGDAGAFREVLEHADEKIAAEMANAQSSAEREALMQQQRMAGEMAKMLGEKGKNGKQNQSGNRQNESNRSNQLDRPSRLAFINKDKPNQNGEEIDKEKEENKPASKGKKEKDRRETPNFGSEQGLQNQTSQSIRNNTPLTPNRQHSNDPINEGEQANQKPGTGSGKKESTWEDLNKNSKTQPRVRAIVKQREDGMFYEYVLPGEDTVVPLVDFLPEFQQASEAAINKKEVPLEYEEFVKNYYLKLYKEVAEKAED